MEKALLMAIWVQLVFIYWYMTETAKVRKLQHEHLIEHVKELTVYSKGLYQLALLEAKRSGE